MRKADMMYLTGTTEALQTVSDILQWVSPDCGSPLAVVEPGPCPQEWQLAGSG